MKDKKIKVAIIGGMYGLAAALRSTGIDVVAASHEIINLKKLNGCEYSTERER